MEKRHLSELFPGTIHRLLEVTSLSAEHLQEIRLRVNAPLLLQYEDAEYSISDDGHLTKRVHTGHICSRKEIDETLEYLSEYSVYAFDEEIRHGFLTIPGGHRIGIAGKTVEADGEIRCIRHISSLNIRISHQLVGCADPLMPYLFEHGRFCHTLILSPPGCGKTTLLRDIIRQLSNGTDVRPGLTIGVVDERSEIGGSYLGIPQNDLGIRTDLLDGCQKATGMYMLLRSMTPQVIAVDEIGSSADREAMEAVFCCGCRMLATAHSDAPADFIRSFPDHLDKSEKQLPFSHLFERYILLGKYSSTRTQKVLDGTHRVLFQQDDPKGDASCAAP